MHWISRSDLLLPIEVLLLLLPERRLVKEDK
jgi:hypothetical protein